MRVSKAMNYEEAELSKEINALRADEDGKIAERQEELDWIAEQLTNMGDEDYRMFIKSIKHGRKAKRYRAGMSTNA